jgi:hypothetical protein
MKINEEELRRKAQEYLKGKTAEEKKIRDLLDKAQDGGQKEEASDRGTEEEAR